MDSARMLSPDAARRVRVWDLFVRVAHWSLAIGFFVAYVSEDALALHVWAGYLAGVIVAARILWGFVGPRHARFADFVTAPWVALTYLLGLFGGRSRRYLGHSPAGGAMAVALLAMVAATGITGLVVYAEEEGQGPLSGIVARVPEAPPSVRADGRARRDEAESAWTEVHEVLANLSLLLVILHTIGVVLASVAHRENLVAAMISGDKRAE